jgi:hypothetical protein
MTGSTTRRTPEIITELRVFCRGDNSPPRGFFGGWQLQVPGTSYKPLIFYHRGRRWKCQL